MKKSFNEEIDSLLEGLELPSDTDIRRETTYKKRSDNPEWHKNRTESMRKTAQTEEWKQSLDLRKEKISKTLRELNKDPARKSMQKENGKKQFLDPAKRKEWSDRTTKQMSDPARRAHLSELAKKQMSDPEQIKLQKEKANLRWQTDEFKKNHAEGVKKYSKPCSTPFGIFSSGAEAGREYNKLYNHTNGKKIVYSNLKNNKEGYYYITREEYEQLKGLQ